MIQTRNWTSYKDNEGGTFGLRYKYTLKQWEEQAMEWRFGCGFDLEDLSVLDDEENQYLAFLRTMTDNQLINYISDMWNIDIKETTWLEVGVHCLYHILYDDFIPVCIKEIRLDENNSPIVIVINEDDSTDNGEEYTCYDISKLIIATDKKCPKCGDILYTSDIPNYDYLCIPCDENFYECEV